MGEVLRMSNGARGDPQLWQHRNDPQFNRQFQQHEGQPYNAEDFDDIFSSYFAAAFCRHSHHRHAARGHDIEIGGISEETLEEQSSEAYD